jgi:hypothetical protein
MLAEMRESLATRAIYVETLADQPEDPPERVTTGPGAVIASPDGEGRRTRVRRTPRS